MSDGRIPVVIGVTGHRNIKSGDREALKASVKDVLGKISAGCRNSEVVVMTALAEGADMLCAETALEAGLKIITVLPMPLDDYAGDFAPGSEARDALYDLAAKSSEMFVAPQCEKEKAGRDYLYRQAGIYIAKHSHVLLSLWDGKPGDPDGCGTAAVTEIKLRSRYGEGAGGQLHPSDGIAIQIYTPREGDFTGYEHTAGEVVIHGDSAALEKILRDTDDYNADCRVIQGSETSPDPGDKVTSRIGGVYEAADRLSVLNSGRHNKVLITLSVAATALAMGFLLYDEAEWHWMILMCGIMIISLFAINSISGKSRYQAKYLEYRMLAETLRVQTYLRTAGLSLDLTDIMPWSLQVSIPWVRRAAAVLAAGEPPLERKSVRDVWIRDQKDYHRNALMRTEKQMRSNDRLVRAALILTLIMYLGALIFEAGWGGLFGGRPAFDPATNGLIRALIKIAMGTFSAITIFANNYYGKQALPNVIDDHRKMIMLYEEAEREIELHGETPELLARLAENEIEENANWYAYRSKHEPELGI